MGNAYLRSIKDRVLPSRPQCNEDAPDAAELDNDVISLLEENARLRALVTQLSDLVLRQVVDQK
jgi:hypothetical protein